MRLEYFSQNTPFQNTVADLGDAPGAPPSPRSKIFSISCSFSQNLAKIYMLALPPPTLAPPPTGNPGSAPEI